VIHTLERSARLPRPLDECFAFFADAANLERITPPELRFRILSPLPIAMREGAFIDYRLRLWGVPVRWRTRIACWEPGRRFVDEQIRGPYRLWEHTHEFRALDDATTEVSDVVRYELPLAPLGDVALPVVRRALDHIFDYRREAMDRLLGRPGPALRAREEIPDPVSRASSVRDRGAQSQA